MGEAKRRRLEGKIRTVFARDLVRELNKQYGCDVWVEGLEENFSHVLLVDADGVHVAELTSGALKRVGNQPHQFIATALLRNGKPWVAVPVLVVGTDYPETMLEAIGEEAARLHDHLRGEETRIPVAHISLGAPAV
jgi:hypothetical protein